MKWKLRLPESSVLVYYLVKLTGLAPFTVKNNKFYPPTLLGKLYPVFVTASYLLFAAVAFTLTVVKKFHTQNHSLFSIFWLTITYLISVSSVCSIIILFLSMHKKIVYVMNKLCTVSNELKSLGIEEDHQKIFKNLFMENAVFVATLAVLFLLEPRWNAFLSIRYSIDSWFGFYMVLIFTRILMCIRQRFTLLNEKLYNLLIPTGHLSHSRHCVRILVASRTACENNQPGSEALTNCQRILRIETLHLELCSLINRTTHVFAIPILLNSLRFSADLVMSSCAIYSVCRHSCQLEIAHIVSCAIRMVVAAVQIFIIAEASATICQQGSATKAVLFKVWIKFRPRELTDEFLTFSNQLLQTPVAVSLFGFWHLDYSFIFQIFGSLVTYVILIIQFDVREPPTM